MLKQEILIAKVQKKANEDERVAAVLMYGSFTQNAGDEFSDVEFYVFVYDAAFNEFDACKWIAEVAPVAACFINNYGTQVAIFENLIRGEFHFLPLSRMDIIRSFAPIGYVPDIEAMRLYDATGALRGYLAKLAASAVQIRRDDAATIEDNVYNCLNLLLMGVNVLRRGEVARAWELLGQAVPFYVRLLRLDEGQTHHWLNPMKNLEGELSGVAYQSFAAATAGLYVQDLERAYYELALNLRDITVKLKLSHNFNISIQLLDNIINFSKST